MSDIATFQGASLDIIDLNGQRWLRGPQIAGALGFAHSKLISTIFKRHKPEFTPDMTTVVELPTAGGPQLVRIFSPRGAALIALLANTPRAAEFRAWVLDTLEARPPIPILPASASPMETLLTTRARAVLRYRRMGLSVAEVSKLVGRSPSTVRVISARLRAGGLLGGRHGR